MPQGLEPLGHELEAEWLVETARALRVPQGLEPLGHELEAEWPAETARDLMSEPLRLPTTRWWQGRRGDRPPYNF
jgi:hypothetical protein